MVSSLLVEALSSPIDVLHSFYDSYDHDSLGEFPQAVAKHFSNIFKTEDAFLEIPPLLPSRSLSSYADHALVRFRALVQDTSPSPEMYLSRRKNGSCGGWGLTDGLQDETDDGELDYSRLRDASVLWAVSVPGETEWYRAAATGPIFTGLTSDQAAVPSRAHKYPIPNGTHHGVQIKMYNTLESNVPKTADVLNFVGILTHEPLHTESEELTVVPTLHVLFIREHKLTVSEAPAKHVPKDVREELLSWIADETLGGDRDAAEWVLLACVARVQSRARSLNPPTLTLSHFPSSTSTPSTPPALSHALSALLPLHVTVPLSLELLNTAPFAPESINEDLHSGYLQLAQGTTILLTESGIQEGKLLERGVLNVRAVQQAMSAQTIDYKFPFSDFSFPTDISFVTLAQGTKSALFQTDITLPFNPSASSDLYKSESDVKLPPADQLGAFRRLILGAKTGKIEVTEAVSEHIQNDFVEQRKANSAMSSEDLKQLITIARLIGLTMRESAVTVEIWEHAKELNKRRKARFA
ncbi:mini-chromosome maintenance replisome factor-domain-containing protein [Gloeopeniophorella convolvens]|nr:mini-chromosome maintenance replisome factor-domain-containing protein [Gloeopeniophorella convolvens]